MTRIVAFSDLHGNTPALEAFLERLPALNADVVVNLGDIASGGVDPRGTLDLLATRPDIVTIRGNHERQVLDPRSHTPGGSDWLAAQVLTPEDRAWIGALPERVQLLPGVLAFHGSPEDDLRYLMLSFDVGKPDGIRSASEGEITTRLGTFAGNYDVYLCGHTHIQEHRRMPDGALVINPGSLGWPAYADDAPVPHRIQTFTSHSRFTVLEDGPEGWVVTHHQIDYDIERAASMAETNGRHDVAHSLRTGFA